MVTVLTELSVLEGKEIKVFGLGLDEYSIHVRLEGDRFYHFSLRVKDDTRRLPVSSYTGVINKRLINVRFEESSDGTQAFILYGKESVLVSFRLFEYKLEDTELLLEHS